MSCLFRVKLRRESQLVHFEKQEPIIHEIINAIFAGYTQIHMGITRNDCRFLFHARSVGVRYDDTCTLGRLWMYATRSDVAECMHDYPSGNEPMPADVKSADGYSDPLYGILGARNVQTVDVSDYEKASLIHDMNVPVPQSWHQTYSCVIDSGTLEHVFNFPVAIRNCMDMIKPGGHFIGITPANNQMGHGFYQFSPELYYRVFSPENGFEMVKMLIPVDLNGTTDWYEVSDPATVKSRVMLVNSIPLSLMFIARKKEHKPVFTTTPQQSDYSVIWKKSDDQKPGAESHQKGMGDVVRGILPNWVKHSAKNIIAFITRKNVRVEGLGVIDKSHFNKVKI